MKRDAVWTLGGQAAVRLGGFSATLLLFHLFPPAAVGGLLAAQALTAPAVTAAQSGLGPALNAAALRGDAGALRRGLIWRIAIGLTGAAILLQLLEEEMRVLAMIPLISALCPDFRVAATGRFDRLSMIRTISSAAFCAGLATAAAYQLTTALPFLLAGQSLLLTIGCWTALGPASSGPSPCTPAPDMIVSAAAGLVMPAALVVTDAAWGPEVTAGAGLVARLAIFSAGIVQILGPVFMRQPLFETRFTNWILVLALGIGLVMGLMPQTLSTVFAGSAIHAEIIRAAALLPVALTQLERARRKAERRVLPLSLMIIAVSAMALDPITGMVLLSVGILAAAFTMEKRL